MAAVIGWLALTVMLTLPLTTSGQHGSNSPERCALVRGRYAIYVERDSLWIVGSKHLLYASNDSLDKMLEDRGWEDWVVFGDFEICTDSKFDPLLLDNHADVQIKSYKNLVFRKPK